jgi:hypothetical protein
MKTLEQAKECLEEWFHDGAVGNIIFYHSPGSGFVDVLVERVVKCREMPPDVNEAFCSFMDRLGVERGEVFRNKEGRPDRIKVTRSIE